MSRFMPKIAFAGCDGGCGCKGCAPCGAQGKPAHFGDASTDLTSTGGLDLGSLVNPSWLPSPPQDLTLSDPGALQPISLYSPPTPNPLVTTYGLDDTGHMVLSSVGTALNNISNALTFQPAPGIPPSSTPAPNVSNKAVLWVAAGSAGALALALAATGGKRRRR